MLIDSCTNNNFTDILKIIRKKKIDYIVKVENNFLKWDNISLRNKKIFISAGVSPLDANNYNKKIENKLLKLIKEKKIISIGEIGLDYADKKNNNDIQKIVFKKQLLLAKKYKLPIIVSCRFAYRDCYKIIKEIFGENNNIKGVLNFNSENKKQIKSFISLGMFISFSYNNYNLKNKKKLFEIISTIPQDKLLIRSLQNISSIIEYNKSLFFLEKIIKTITKARKKVNIEDIKRITAQNAISIFGLSTKHEDVYVYKIRNSLYINLTNRCTNNCVFCPRIKNPTVKGYNLRISKEPSAIEIIKKIDNPKKYDEIVFCGYGEPTLRLQVVKKIAKWVKENKGKTRLNTNGHGNIIAGRDITSDLKNLFDIISISLNFHNKELYIKNCKPIFGKKTWDELLDFIRKIKNTCPNVIITAIEGYKGVNIIKCNGIAKKLRVKFRKRTYYKK